MLRARSLGGISVYSCPSSAYYSFVDWNFYPAYGLVDMGFRGAVEC